MVSSSLSSSFSSLSSSSSSSLSSSSSSNAVQTKLVIDLDEGEDTEDLNTLFLMHPTTTKQNITKVRVESSWEDVEEWIDGDTVTYLFECLGELDNLQQLHLNLGCGMSLPVTLLANVVQQSTRLQMLCLDSLTLTGSPAHDEFEALAQAVRQHSSLACVCLTDIEMKENSVAFGGVVVEGGAVMPPSRPHQATAEAAASYMEPFLVSLALECPSMRVLELEQVPTSATALMAIASSKHLRDLELWTIPSVSECMPEFSTGLQANSALRELQILDCALDQQAGQLLADLLQQNTSLTSVTLDIDWGSKRMFGKPIASILRGNRTLTRLHLVCRQNQYDDNNQVRSAPITKVPDSSREDCTAEAYANMICEGLAFNTSLQRLTLEFRQSRGYRNDNSRLAAAFTEPLQQALENNCVLEHFALMGGKAITPVLWRRDVAFYLQMNRTGIRQQWRNATNDARRIQTLLQLQQRDHDLSTIFYLLSAQPPHCLLCVTN